MGQPARDQLHAERAELEALSVIALHPHIAHRYREQVAALAAALAWPESLAEAMPNARALIASVTVTPREDALRGVDIEVEGRLPALAGGTPLPESTVKAGAGKGNRTPLASLEG